MKRHLNDHISGRYVGALPADFLHTHRYSQCLACSFLIHYRYNGVCPSCQEPMRAIAAARSMAQPVAPAVASGGNHSRRRQAPSLDDIFDNYVPTWKHIPKQLQPLWSKALAQAVAAAVASNGVQAWSDLLMLPKCVLCSPPRSGKAHHNKRLAFTRSRLQRWVAGERGSLWDDIPSYTPPRNKRISEEAVKHRRHAACIDLCGEGALGKSCSSLVQEAPLGRTRAVADQLREKHPVAAAPPDLSHLAAPGSGAVPRFECEAVLRAIRSFSPHSGAGPSALRPLHLQKALHGAHRDEVVGHITALAQLLAKGEAPRVLAPYLAGGALTALPKDDGSIRPVAVGETWRRLTAKLLCADFQEQASAYLWPLQIGVSQSRGTEVGLHVARQWCRRNAGSPNAVFLKIDFENAFNTVSRQAFLEQCRHRFPGLSPYAEWCYDNPSQLFFGSHRLASQCGVQQGDPLGPLLFSLALQPVLQKLRARRCEGGLQLFIPTWTTAA